MGQEDPLLATLAQELLDLIAAVGEGGRAGGWRTRRCRRDRRGSGENVTSRFYSGATPVAKDGISHQGPPTMGAFLWNGGSASGTKPGIGGVVSPAACTEQRGFLTS